MRRPYGELVVDPHPKKRSAPPGLGSALRHINYQLLVVVSNVAADALQIMLHEMSIGPSDFIKKQLLTSKLRVLLRIL